MSPLEDVLVDAFAPFVRRLVRDEVRRAQLEWRWAPVPRAAELLGLTEEAVRQRVRRGQLPGRRVDGRVYVDLEALGDQFETGGRGGEEAGVP